MRGIGQYKYRDELRWNGGAAPERVAVPLRRERLVLVVSLRKVGRVRLESASTCASTIARSNCTHGLQWTTL